MVAADALQQLGACPAAVCRSRLDKELVRAREHAVLMAIPAGALQGLYGDSHRL